MWLEIGMLGMGAGLVVRGMLARDAGRVYQGVLLLVGAGALLG